MKHASYRVRGRDRFGAVAGKGVTDRKPRLGPRDGSVFDPLRGGSLIAYGDTFTTLKFGDVLEIEAPGVGGSRNTALAEL